MIYCRCYILWPNTSEVDAHTLRRLEQMEQTHEMKKDKWNRQSNYKK